MSLLRSFLAVEMPVALQRAVYDETAGIRELLGPELVKWVPQENLHLTLKFLGDTAPSAVEQIKAALQAQVSHFEPLLLVLHGFGAFPNTARPRVLWVGLGVPPAFRSIQREIDLATVRLGYGAEERQFTPHLTVGRVRPNLPAAQVQRLRAALEHTSVRRVGTLEVDAIHLFKSTLQPGGSVYTKLWKLSFAGT
jgi:2'-5' RNA ligase